MSSLLSNPDAMREMMDSPLVSSMMSNPDLMRSLMMVRGPIYLDGGGVGGGGKWGGVNGGPGVFNHWSPRPPPHTHITPLG
jgi:hypothetical protein